MSKTDATRPLHIRLTDRHDWYEAAHDHSTGKCDLPEDPARALSGRQSTRCTWSSTMTAVHTTAATGTGCTCNVCADRPGRRRARRAERQSARRYATQGWRNEYL